jgi:two-component system phosphate regulon sensor histidine kinase PhoR
VLSSRFFRRLFLRYLLLLCAATGSVGFFSALRFRTSYVGQTEQSLSRQAELIWALAGPKIESGDFAALEQLVRGLDDPRRCRVTIIAGDGHVLADNQADPGRMESPLNQPELAAALDQGNGTSVRSGNTLDGDMLYVARREANSAGKIFFVRCAVHLADLDRELRVVYGAIAAISLAAMCVAAALCFHLASLQAEPVRDVAAFANALSRGELNRRFHPSGGGEIKTLTTSLNTMAESLSGLIAQTTNDRAELSAILASMSEGVIAADRSQRILLANEKAAELLDFDAAGAIGKALWEVLRIEPILRTATETLAGEETRAFPVSPTMGRHLEITVRRYPLAGPPTGIVIVAHDTTRSVRYQELRKEFVANVSHELRTPLTVIKGFTETLQDGALRDPEKGMQFLATISKHVDQLTNLVNDLLELSRLEGSPELPRPVSIDVGTLARRVTDLLVPAAQKKKQALRLDTKANLPKVLGNPDYIDRAIANLVDNAIKYTQEGGTISVMVGRRDDDVFVEVADNGLGIPADDIPRIFERFYRVDRSRSREMGGTGLGLSIVKHVAQVHGGGIDVSSTPGAGSKFRLYFPIPHGS